MQNILSAIISSLTSLHPSFIGAAGLGVMGTLFFFLMSKNILIRSALRKFEKGEKDKSFRRKLLARPRIIEALIRHKGIEIVVHFDIVDHLQQRLSQWNRLEDAQRLLLLPDFQGAFPVFLASLKKEHIADKFKAWLKETPNPLLIRTMALSSGGQKFDGRKALRLLNNTLPIVRELSGDTEWPVRFFSLQVLLADNSIQSLRIVSDAFSDSHHLLRRTAVREAVIEPDDLFNRLLDIALNDPVSDVRRCARERIESEFPHRWQLRFDSLNTLHIIHVLEQLKIGSKEDENIAITTLKGQSSEARLVAARFLEKSGTLKRLLIGANLGDMEDWDRRYTLLSNSISVGIVNFLAELRSHESIDVLLLGVRLLQNGGDRNLIAYLAEKAFAHQGSDTSSLKTFYRETVILACKRGSEKARALVRRELRKQHSRNDILTFILPILPHREAHVFKDVLLEFLVDPDFTADHAYLDIMSRLPSSMFISSVLDVLEAEITQYPKHVRLRALRVLGEWRLDETLQTIIENLPILPPHQFPRFAEHFATMNKKTLEERVAFILASSDTRLRAVIISCLPAASIEALSKDIREGLKDANPEIRIACIRALSSIKGMLTSAGIIQFLRDPVEEVRQETARIAGRKATQNILKMMERLLNDTEESPVVRTAVLEGLSVSQSQESINIMVRFLSLGHDLRDELMSAITKKTDKKFLVSLVEYFKNSEVVLKDKLTDVFVAMHAIGEEALLGILPEVSPSLKPYLADILTRTGFVDILIHRLGSRTPQMRREAAELLSNIGTVSAYRGIVFAARDPDKEVRIHATKALEFLANPESENILYSLKTDPDRKVRHYTLWAMERIKAKKLP